MTKWIVIFSCFLSGFTPLWAQPFSMGRSGNTAMMAAIDVKDVKIYQSKGAYYIDLKGVSEEALGVVPRQSGNAFARIKARDFFDRLGDLAGGDSQPAIGLDVDRPEFQAGQIVAVPTKYNVLALTKTGRGNFTLQIAPVAGERINVGAFTGAHVVCGDLSTRNLQWLEE